MEASVDGVLGGYGHVNETDVRCSEAFLKTLLAERFGSGGRHLVALGTVSVSALYCYVSLLSADTVLGSGFSSQKWHTKKS